jgi:uncharacterized membrane protein
VRIWQEVQALSRWAWCQRTGKRSTVAPLTMARRKIGLSIVFLWFFIGGIAHFAFTEAEMRIVPPYIPWPWVAVIVSGVFELVGAAGILWKPTRLYAGLGLMALTIAVTPAHIYMLQQPELFGVPVWALWLRLPIQVGLLWLIWWSTVERPRRR